jgi:hypothetical protein
MTRAVAHIIEKVEQLSASERIELHRLVAQRVTMTDDLTDEDFATIAAESFRRLDNEGDFGHDT